jgi:hypothetical protein
MCYRDEIIQASEENEKESHNMALEMCKYEKN